MRWTRMLLGAAVALLVSVAPAHAATFRVIGLNDSEMGCIGTQCPSIRSAIAAAKLSPVPDTIVVPAGEYFLTFGQLLVDSPVTIVGEGARDTTIHGRPQVGGFRVLEVPSGVEVTVVGVALADGRAIGSSENDTFLAGGIIRNRGTLTLDRVRVTGGHASSGGGIANTGGTLTIERSLIDGNQADIGGGDAGGLLNFNGGTIVMRNSTIANNTAVKGGALFTWKDNGAANSTELEHATVIANQGGSFGGLHTDTGDSLRLRATVVAGNTPSNCSGSVQTLGYNVSNTQECGLGEETDRPGMDVHQGNGSTDVGGDTNVWPVAADSPAVNLIPACDGTDQRGVSRPQGAGCDAGAYEHDPVRIDTGPEGFTNNRWPAFTFSGAHGYTCALESQEEVLCFSPFSSEVGLPDGDYVFRLTGYDVDGAVIGRVKRAITIDTQLPDAPVITSPQNGATVDEVVLEGTAEPFATVTVRDNEGDWTETAADEEGAWMLVIPDEPPGEHEYFVRQIDRAGNQSEGMAVIALTVSGSDPPRATITKRPPDLSNDVHPVFEFEADVPEATFQCRHTIIGNEEIPWEDAPTCESPHQMRDLPDGRHRFEVRARIGDEAGEADIHEFTIDTLGPPPPEITAPDDNTVLRDLEPLTVSGEVLPIASVDVYDNGALLGPATITNQGEGWEFPLPQPAPGRHVFTAIATDPAGNPSLPSTAVTVYVHPNGPTASIAGPTLTNDATPTFTVTVDEPGATIECATDGASYEACESPVTLRPLSDGEYTLSVRPTGADNVSGASATHTFTVDLTPPAAPQVSGGPAGNAATFTVAAEEGVTLECRLEGPGRAEPFAPCSGRLDYSGLAPGSYRFVVRASDRAGNLSETVREFSVATVQPQITPTPTPTPTATPTPQPEFRESAVARPTRGRVLVRRPGSNEFVELDGSESIPMGSTIDAKRGRVRITAETRPGRPPQRAEFYEGIFRITQTRTLVDVRLVEQLAPCPRKASAAQKRKPKSRRLWGSGKGRFRTTGKYSAATVRGTTWLVKDSCAGTLTRVTQGVVAVRDKRLKKTILVRKGKRYLARARR